MPQDTGGWFVNHQHHGSLSSFAADFVDNPPDTSPGIIDRFPPRRADGFRLILPLAMPVLIFGARTVSLAAANDAVAAGVYFLAAYCMLTLTLAPFATAAALRISTE